MALRPKSGVGQKFGTVVAKSSLEVPGHPGGIRLGLQFSSLTSEKRTVVAEEDHTGNGVEIRPEREHPGFSPRLTDGGSGERGAEVGSKDIRHGRALPFGRVTDTEQFSEPTDRFEAVLIDWAGTITVPMHEMVSAAASELGFSQDDLTRAFAGLAEYFLSDDSPIHQAERGQIDDDDLAEFLDEQVPGASRLIFATDAPSFLNGADRPEMITLLEDLYAADVTVVLATNNFRTAQDLLATRYLDTGLVAAIVNSALIGHRKPEPRFYEIALEAAGVEPGQALFVDDQSVNLEPARQLGLGTVLVADELSHSINRIRAAVL